MSAVTYRNFSNQLLRSVLKTSYSCCKSYYTHDNAVTVGSEQDKKSDNFQVRPSLQMF